MARRCRNWLVFPTCVILCLASGCYSPAQTYSLAVPEQRHIDVREPEQIPSVSLPYLPPPVTVSNPAPTFQL